MTRKRTVSISIVLIGLLICAGILGIWVGLISGSNINVGGEFQVNFPASLGPTGNPSFELSADLPDVKEEIMIYKIKQPDVSIDTVTQIGSGLGFEGDVTDFSRDGLQMKKDKAHLIVWSNSGAVEYNHGIAFSREARNLPSNEEAKIIATEFLRETGLLPPAAIVQDPVPGTTFAGPATTASGEVVSESYVVELLVRFNRYIDGIPVTGKAPLGVRIGNNGEISRVLKIWPEIEPYKKMKIKAPEKAFQELKDGQGTHYASQDCKKVVLNRIYLGYYMQGDSAKEDYLLPIYAFEGESLDQNGKHLEDFYGYCNAI